MIDLKYASEDLKKAAYLKGVIVGENKPWFETVDNRLLIGQSAEGYKNYGLFFIGQYLDSPHYISVDDIEFVASLTWDEIKEGF